MSSVIGGSKAFWTDFIKTYESLPVLWNIKSEVYKNRQLKDEAYEILVMKLQKIEPNANRDIVRRKINSLRCSYRRELNKIKESQENAVVPDLNGFYRTSLWYFELMSFLNNDESFREKSFVKSRLDTKDRIPPARVPSPPVSSDGDSKEASNAAPSAPSAPNFTVQIPAKKSQTQPPPFKKIKLTHQEHDAPFTEGYLEDAVPSFQLKTSNIRKSPPPRPNPRIYQDEGSHICSSCPCVAAQENEYDKIGKAWASELKLMSKEQQIFAKRAIAEIIFEGQLGGLSRHSVLIRQDNPTNEGEPFVIHENAEFLFEKSSQHSTGV
ncbi:uncharacterized protein LOC129952582 isoform X2 [Eupeodes corollae]|uniref:uncharacterized protein LOC129952582 isoform X2 n=1 Tax=Eupeodes corollae TaxID=290404 RepID=UPI0024909C05|nr:uncharacterized protein LOC129952582 isoform X2 [Eupeodes corollae]